MDAKINKENFDLLVDKAMLIPGRSNLRQVVEKELLHYDILFALDERGLLDKLIFQGGTSLRLCYGTQRMSEDLDFAGGKDFSKSQLLELNDCIEQYVSRRYDLKTIVKNPKEMSTTKQYQDIKVDVWQISVITAPKQSDIPRQRIKIEVASIPAYTKVPRALQVNYDFLPDGYSDVIINTESLEEIMADKIIAYVCAKNIRHRDIWDLRWLVQQGMSPNIELINNKIRDYKISDYLERLQSTIDNLDHVISSKNFLDQMTRFLSTDTLQRTLYKDKFKEYLILELKSLFSTVQMKL